MELYYAVHIALFISTLFECSSLKNKQRIMILWCIFFILFGGLRWEIGGDWDQYYEHFQNSSWDNIFIYSTPIIVLVKCSLLLSITASIFYILYYIYKLTGIGGGYLFEMICIPYKTIFDYGYQLF